MEQPTQAKFPYIKHSSAFFVKRSESPGPFQRFSQMGFFLKDSEKALQGIIWGRTCRNGRVGVLQEVACGKSWKKLVKWEDQIGVRQCSDPSPPGSVCLLTSGHSGHEQGVGASSYNSHKYGIVRRLPASPLLPDTANAILHIPDPSYNLSCVHGTPAHPTFFLIFFMFFILTPFEKKPHPSRQSPALFVPQMVCPHLQISGGVPTKKDHLADNKRSTVVPPWKGQLLQTGVHMLAEDEEKEAHGTS